MPPRNNDPIHSLTLRRIILVLLVVPILAVFVPMVLHHKGAINIEEYGMPENYLYFGAVAVFLICAVGIVLVWRCPGCGAYLGKELNPASCLHCGAALK